MSQMRQNEPSSVKAQFSFYLSVSTWKKSKLTFGNYDLDSYAKKGSSDSDIMWFKNTQDNKDNWTQKLNSINFAGKSEHINS